MKLLVFEYACAGGEGGEPFKKEGMQMLSHLVASLSKLGLERVSAILSPSSASPLFADEIVRVKGDLGLFFEQELARHDAVWIIAPECDGVLLDFTRVVESSGKLLIGSSSSAVEICGDKLLTFQALDGRAETPDTFPFTGSFDCFPCVVKPIDGAGCNNTILVGNSDEMIDLDLPVGKFIVQPYMEGTPMSVGVASSGTEAVLLGVSRQLIEVGSALNFAGLDGPIAYPRMDKIEGMIKVVMENIPGLNGYWGMDFIDRPAGPVLIEINPRLTSSFPVYRDRVPFDLIFSDARRIVHEGI